MARTRPWEVSDEFRTLVESLIPSTDELRKTSTRSYQRESGAGRKRKYDDRICFSAIVYVLRIGIIWNVFPREKRSRTITSLEKLQGRFYQAMETNFR